MTTRADREAQAFADKAAESVQEWQDRNVAMGGVCDFCATPIAKLEEPIVTYVAGEIFGEMLAVDLVEGGTGTVEFGWDPYWATCANCAKIVEEGDPVALARNAIENRDKEIVGPIHDEQATEAELTMLYMAFFASNPTRVDGPPEYAKEMLAKNEGKA